MTTLAATPNSVHAIDNASQPPSKVTTPTSPTSFHTQQITRSRSFMSLRGQTAPFPSTSQSNALLEPPSGQTYVEFIRGWTDNHVARWLMDIKCGAHASTFRENDIRGDVLLELDQITLKEMGVSSIGDRLRILNAVKTLRQRTSPSPRSLPLHNFSTPKVYVNGTSSGGELSPTVPGSPLIDSSATPRLTSRRLEVGRPPPLHLGPTSKQSDLPRILRDGLDSARINQAGRPLGQPLPSVPTTPNTRTAHPLLPPAPRTQPPPAPPRTTARNLINGSAQVNGRRTPTQADVPPYASQPLPPAPSGPSALLSPGSATITPWAGYGLPSDPRPGNAGGKPVRSAPSPPNVSRSPQRAAPIHGRNTSLSILEGHNSTNPASKLPARPSTGNSPSAHPYAQGNPPGFALSPIAESFLNSATSPPAGYAVGRGPYGRPTTPSNTNTPSLDDLRRRLIKFFLADEGHSCTINVADCVGGIEVLEKALKKFGKGGQRSADLDNVMDHVQTEDGGLLVDGWGVYLGQGDNFGEPLSEGELLAVCHAAPDNPVRENGLTLKRTGRAKRTKALAQVFGESPPSASQRGGLSSPNRIGNKTSPGSSEDRDSRGDVSPEYSQQDFFPNTQTPKNTRRASSISILSGLGVRDPEKALDPPLSPSQPRAAPPPPASTKRPSKLRNFFGQRPPSELITTHLTEYFPFTEKKVLERTARNSMLRTSGISGFGSLASRFSTSTQSSLPRTSISSPRASMSSFTTRGSASGEDPPRVSVSTDDGVSVDITSMDVQPQLLPPVNLPTESFSESLESMTGDLDRAQQRASRALSIASRRTSYLTELRSKRDRSDTASLMTVDQITAEVESRRESMAPESAEGLEEWTAVGAVEAGDLGESSEASIVTVDDEEDGELLEGDEVPLNDDLEETGGLRVPPRANKWIKGALIGAGSFGNVYLGMDAASGLLMAVKQVELPTGSAPNEERKKSMLSALEREIEFLKNLQHENIVQYLYSSLEDDHLNIFLEYVPGGSVTALLRNYGAFEEPLVRNFVRQILQGLHYLHERDIIHRDIKGANILVDNKGGIKISDFGISKKVEDNLMGGGNRAHRPSLQGSVFWMAPEVVKQTPHSTKADIWSLGCLVVEMLTGQHPWASLSQMQAIFKIGCLEKPAIPEDISSEAQDFLTRTFDLDPEARPPAGELLQHAWIKESRKMNATTKNNTSSEGLV